MYWEFFSRRTKPFIFWLEIIQQIIRIESSLFLDVSVVVFFICGQLIVNYYEILNGYLTPCASAKDKFVRFASISPRISTAATLLGSQFSLILLTNCVNSFCCLLFFCWRDCQSSSWSRPHDSRRLGYYGFDWLSHTFMVALPDCWPNPSCGNVLISILVLKFELV